MDKRWAYDRGLFVTESDVLSAGKSVAWDKALLNAVSRGEHGPALHLYRLRPTVLIGCYQWVETEVRHDYCVQEGIDVARRRTGGGALYVDEGQLAWSLVLPKPSRRELSLRAVLDTACQGIVATLAKLEVEAWFSAPNEVEVAQRRIASCYARAAEGAILVQGTVLLSIDIDRMLHALRVPTEKLSPQGMASARQRLTTLSDVLGVAPPLESVRNLVCSGLADAFGLSIATKKSGYTAAVAAPSDTGTSTSAAAIADDEAEAVLPCAGSVLRARLRIAGDPPRIERLRLTGDVMLHPPDLFARLAARLRNANVESWRARLAEMFAEQDIEIIGFTPHDIARLIARVLNRGTQQQTFGVSVAEANRLVVHGPEHLSAEEIVRRATVMLVPYCAKKVNCKWRLREGCPECGLCEVGEAYRIARDCGMQAITITNYEHLVSTLAEIKRNGVEAFVGMCCLQFYIKRNKAFDEAGIASVLMDISGSNCYELHEEEQAYQGAFEEKAELDIPLLEKVTALRSE